VFYTDDTRESVVENDFHISSQSQLKDGAYQTTFNDAFLQIRNHLLDYNPHYLGRDEDINRLTAAMEEALLDDMIAIPLYVTTTTWLYSSRVVIEANDYHVFMPFDDLRYMYLKKI
jgi:ABC-type oligopeptide transport system substrate-binding subunit